MLGIPVQLPGVGVCFQQRCGRSHWHGAVGCKKADPSIVQLVDPSNTPHHHSQSPCNLGSTPSKSSFPPW